MTRIYQQDRSFIASLSSARPGYVAGLAFSTLHKEQVEFTDADGEQSYTAYIVDKDNTLNLTTRHDELPRFWFLCRQWDDGALHYEIKTLHDGFLTNLCTTNYSRQNALTQSLESFPLYIQPKVQSSGVSGWRLYTGTLEKAEKQLDSSKLKPGEYSPVWLMAPTQQFVGMLDKTPVGNHWWARASCAAKDAVRPGAPLPLPLKLTIHDVNVAEPQP